MTLPQVYDLFEYWSRSPPEHEMMALLAQVYTTWRPDRAPMTEAEHRRSLEARWKAGAMNPKQLFEAWGGQAAVIDPSKGLVLPGIGPFPGTVN